MLDGSCATVRFLQFQIFSAYRYFYVIPFITIYAAYEYIDRSIMIMISFEVKPGGKIACGGQITAAYILSYEYPKAELCMPYTALAATHHSFLASSLAC